MTSVEQPVKRTHMEECWSIIAALAGAVATTFFLWNEPGFQPLSDLAWIVPGWFALAYVLIQMACLLTSATQVRALGVVDTIVAIVPVIAAVVTGVEWGLGRLALWPFQINVLMTMLVASIGEFLLTMWRSFSLNQHAISVE